MADVTWFKVLTDIFSDDKIKILQSMPEGDALLVMWFKVLSQAGKTNDGGYIYLKKNIPYSPAMLSTLFGKPQQLVELAMRTFSEFGMIDIDDSGYVFVTNWEKHQSIDRLDKIKEQTRLRVQSHREKKQLELQQSNATVTLPVTKRNATELELDIELDIEEKIKDNVPYAEIITYLNTQADKNYKSNTEASREHIRARWAEGFVLEDFKKAIDNKVAEWKGTKNDKYLRPQTLFNCEKFQGYVNEIIFKGGNNGQGIRQGDTTGRIEPIKGKNGILPSKYAADFAQVQ